MEITGQFVALVPVVIALTQVARTVGLPDRYAPLVAIVLGVIGAVGLSSLVFSNVLVGVVVGLTSAGLYSGVKTTVQG